MIQVTHYRGRVVSSRKNITRCTHHTGFPWSFTGTLMRDEEKGIIKETEGGWPRNRDEKLRKQRPCMNRALSSLGK